MALTNRAGKTTDINLHGLYTNLQISPDNRGRRVIAALDNEKALDSVEWSFMLQLVLTPLGFPHHFLAPPDLLEAYR